MSDGRSGSKLSLAPALAQLRALNQNKRKEREQASQVESVLDANASDVGAVDNTARSEAPPALHTGQDAAPQPDHEVPLHIDQEEQLTEPWGSVQPWDQQPGCALKRLRKLNSAGEEAKDSPFVAPSSLQDSLSKSSGQQVEGGQEAAHEDDVLEEGEDINGDDSSEGGIEDEEHNDPENEWRANETICSNCDDGGHLVLCDGACMRAFHAGVRLKEEGAENLAYVDDDGPDQVLCNPLQMGAELYTHYANNVNALLECPNCLAHRHQCFICKQEGNSVGKEEGLNPNWVQEVYRCVVFNCAKFYHPKCLGMDPEAVKQNFMCPQHSCKRCKEGDAPGRQLIRCRRCPTAYHIGCLPKKILNAPVKRVWITKGDDGNVEPLLPEVEGSRAVEPRCEIGQSLLYCMKHPMEPGDATPAHERPLFEKKLRRKWAEHIAELYPDLLWSQNVMQRVAAMKEARREAAERKRLQAAAAAAAAAAAKAPRPASASAASKASVSAKAAAAGAPRRPASAKGAAAAAAAAQPTSPVRGDEEDVPLAERIAAAKRKKAQKLPAPRFDMEAAFIPLEDTQALSGPAAVKSTSSLSRPSTVQSVQQQSASFAGEAGRTGLEVCTSGTQQAEAGTAAAEESPAVPEGLHASAEALGKSAPSARPEPAEAASQGSADAHMEDDMWTADADDEADDADREAAKEAARPDGEAAAAGAEAARAAAAATDAEESFLLPCERESYWTKEAVAQRLSTWWRAAEQATPFQKILRSARQPSPYDMSAKASVAQERLKSIRNSLEQAQREPQKVRVLVPPTMAVEAWQHEDNLRMVLMPLLHSDRFTSYGRHFTLPPLLEQVNQLLLPFLVKGDTVVDFSCGYNVWLPMLKRMCIESGFEIQCCAFDIITAKDTEDFKKDTWFNVKPGQLPRSDKLVIGLNPPFGKDGCLANKFVDHAAKIQPRMIILIVPPATRVPPGYRVLLDDRQLMKGDAFFVPGANKASWNNVPPATRILVREKFFQQAVERMNIHAHVIDEHYFPPLQPQMMPQPMSGHLRPSGPMYNAQQNGWLLA